MTSFTNIMQKLASFSGKKTKAALGVATISTLVNAAANLIQPFLIAAAAKSFDDEKEDINNSFFNYSSTYYVLGAAGVWVTGQTFYYVRSIMLNYLSNSVAKEFSKEFIAHINSISYQERQLLQEGALQDQAQINMALDRFMNNTFFVIPYIVEVLATSFIIGYKYEWEFFIGLAIAIIISSTLSVALKTWTQKADDNQDKQVKRTADSMNEIFNNYETIKYYNCLEQIITECNDQLEQMRLAYFKASRRSDASSLMQLPMSALVVGGMTLYSSYLIKKREHTLDDFFFIGGYLYSMFSGFVLVGTSLKGLGTAYSEIKSSISILDKPKEDIDNGEDLGQLTEAPTIQFNLVSVKISAKEIELKNQDIGDIERDDNPISILTPSQKYFITGLNFTLEPNKITALVGRSGCGKTSIAKLLFGFYKPISGEIRINDKDVNKFSLKSIRKNICMVPQVPGLLLNHTLRANLKLAKPDENDNNLNNILMQVGLNKSLDDKVRNFSLGEKQRISIARGLLRKARIFIFDEVTSALDNESQKIIMDLIFELKKSATILVIAHRLETIKDVEQIICLRKEENEDNIIRIKVVGQGTHEQIINSCDEYRTLYADIRDDMELSNDNLSHSPDGRLTLSM